MGGGEETHLISVTWHASSFLVGVQQLRAKIRSAHLDPREEARALAAVEKDYPRGICVGDSPSDPPGSGVDGLRFALAAYTTSGRNINLDADRVYGYRMFCGKIFQATNFLLKYLPRGFVRQAPVCQACEKGTQTRAAALSALFTCRVVFRHGRQLSPSCLGKAAPPAMIIMLRSSPLSTTACLPTLVQDAVMEALPRMGPMERWIVSRLQTAVKTAIEGFDRSAVR